MYSYRNMYVKVAYDNFDNKQRYDGDDDTEVHIGAARLIRWNDPRSNGGADLRYHDAALV